MTSDLNQARQLFLSGTAALENGELVSAEKDLLNCLALAPGRDSVKNNLSMLYLKKGDQLADSDDHQSALNAYDQAIYYNPENFIAHSNKGVLLFDRLDHTDDAIDCYAKAISLNPQFSDALQNMGVAKLRKKEFSAALDYLEKSLSIDPNLHEAWSNRASVLNELGRHEEAVSCQEKAVGLKPGSAELWNNLGKLLGDLSRHEEALKALERAISLDDQSAMVWNNLGKVFIDLHKPKEALSSLSKAIALDPSLAEAWNNQGLALADIHQFEESQDSFTKAIALKPGFVEALCNKAYPLGALGRHKEAEVCLNQAISIRQEDPSAHWNLSLTLLRLGDFNRGWKLYEWRWKNKNHEPSRVRFPERLWLGNDDLKGKVILLRSEQGFGDTIQFSRYAPMLKKLGAKVLLEVQPELVSLMRSLDGVENVSEIGNSPTVYDFETPLLSLPLAFKTQVNNIPSNIPYLYVESDKKDFWANRFSANTMRPHIGITWAGNPKHQNDRNRSLELKHLSNLVSTKFEWIALSTNLSKFEKEVTRSVDIKNYAIDVKDFSDTAGLICNLDLVITVDTSVAHLAGALGKPTWVLLPFVPDFRWFWDREDSPWYPSMRLFRQSSPGDWDSVLSRVTSELDNHFKLN